MGNYFFPKDLEQSKVAVDVVIKHLHDTLTELIDLDISVLPKDRQAHGDIHIISKCGSNYTVEIKYDMMAAKTGNLCFESANAKGESTGVFGTEAHQIHYVVPAEGAHDIYKFYREDLLSYLRDPNNTAKIRSVNGGDRRAYTMLLVPIDCIVGDFIPFDVIYNAKL